MANEANPLLSLSSEKQQQIVDLVDNGNIDKIADKGGMTRRQVLQVAVALGAGATVGGYSVDQIIGEARAAADTSDSDGNVGLPGDRVDLFAEGADVSGTVTANAVGSSSDRFTGFADDLDVSNPTVLVNEGGIQTYPASASGIESAVADARSEFRLFLPPGSYNMGTTTLSPPRRGIIRGAADQRGTRLKWDEGVGTAIAGDAATALEHITISGPSSSTSTDIGFTGDTTDGFSRFYAVNFDGFAKNVHLDNHFNSTFTSCVFGGATGDASAFGEAGSVHIDVNSGSNNNTRFVNCFWPNNSIGPGLVIEANEVFVSGYQGENNEAGEIKIAFGSGHQIFGVRSQNLTGGDGIVIDDGSTMIIGTDMEASGSGQIGINFRNVAAGDAKVAGPHHFSGFGTNFNGVGTTTSVEQRES